MDKIAVLIPCYNESRTIEKVVTDFKRVLPEATIYVYDNNSTDGTDELARGAGATVRYEYRQGKGNVLRRMFRDDRVALCGAALLAAFAFLPLWRKKQPEQGRVLTLALFAALAFLPSSWAAYTLRVYRDNIFPALCLYFFAGMAGMALRAVFEKDKPLWPWLAAAGAGLVCGYLDREDAGLFLLPFAAAATVIVAVVLVGQRRWKALAAQVIPYAMLGVGVLTFCTLNYTHYGVFALSDFSEGPFAAAMGAMMYFIRGP